MKFKKTLGTLFALGTLFFGAREAKATIQPLSPFPPRGSLFMYNLTDQGDLPDIEGEDYGDFYFRIVHDDFFKEGPDSQEKPFGAYGFPGGCGNPKSALYSLAGGGKLNKLMKDCRPTGSMTDINLAFVYNGVVEEPLANWVQTFFTSGDAWEFGDKPITFQGYDQNMFPIGQPYNMRTNSAIPLLTLMPGNYTHEIPYAYGKISFKQIPEPATVALLGLGSLAALLIGKKKKKRKK